MSARYFCDKCGSELYWITTGTVQNSDGNKTFDIKTHQWLDLCHKCREKLLKDNEEETINYTKNMRW